MGQMVNLGLFLVKEVNNLEVGITTYFIRSKK